MEKPNYLKGVKKRSKDEVEAEIIQNCHAMDAFQQQWMGGVPPRYRLEASRLISGRISNPRKFIRMKCLDCVGFEDATDRIRNCRITVCPLWQARPFQKFTEK